jgi:phosphatidylinositol-3-phosphatase
VIFRRLIVLVAAALSLSANTLLAAEQKLPQPDHIVVVILENHSFNQILNSKRKSFITDLASRAAIFKNSFAIGHPSQPNYFVLFSGSTHAVSDNHDHTFDAPNLADALLKANRTFLGFAEHGSPRKHNPWESFSNARATGRTFSMFPRDFTQLPTVCFVVPNLKHDMHDGSIREGDTWLKDHLTAYTDWAMTHNSLLIITFDEDDSKSDNRIPTMFVGAHVRPGRYSERITHFNVLRTILAMYALPAIGETAASPPIRTIWDR